MKIITKILIRELFSCWSSWDVHSDFYLYTLFPGLMRGSIPTSSPKETEMVGLIDQLIKEEGTDYSKINLEEIRDGNFSIGGITSEIKSLISKGNFSDADMLYDQIKALPFNSLNSHEYMALKKTYLDKSVAKMKQLIMQDKIDEAEKLYLGSKELAKVFDFKKSKNEYYSDKESNEVIGQLSTFLQSGEFMKADNLFDQKKDLLQNNFNKDNYLSLKEAAYINLQKTRVPIDGHQARAIVLDPNNLLIAARAGSGKTSTLANKLHYFNQYYGVDANSVMMISFNKNARKEMASRVRKAGLADYENARTFHSLAYSIVNNVNGVGQLLLDEKEAGVEKILSNYIQDIVKEKLSIAEIREILYNDFFKEINELEEEEYCPRFDSVKHFDQIKRKYMEISLRGDRVKSWGEKYIADSLFENGLNYEYEKYFEWDNKPYHPDFTIKNESNEPVLIIEYWGLRNSKEPSYNEQIERKRLYWLSKNIKLIEINADQIRGKREDFEKMILTQLTNNGIETKPKSKQELIETTLKRNISSLTDKVRQFIQKAQKSMLSVDEIRLKIEKISHKRSQTFNRFSLSVYAQYLERLESQHETDFDCLIKDAIEIITNRKGDIEIPLGKTGKLINLKDLNYLFLDEYQDFSKLFFELVRSLRCYNKNLKIVAVGDDWQAINGFAGSDLFYFEHFSKLFSEKDSCSDKTYLLYNYRSNSEIVRYSNQFMKNFEFNGQACEPNKFEKGTVKKIPLYNGRGGLNQSSILKIAENIGESFIKSYLDNMDGAQIETTQPAVMVLTRKNNEWRNDKVKIKDALKHYIIKKCPQLKKLVISRSFDDLVVFKNIHQSKGEEADAVVILDVNSNDFPLMHPDSSLYEIFGVTAEKVLAEEIRLFYVAITRAKKDLSIFYRDRLKSSFVI